MSHAEQLDRNWSAHHESTLGAIRKALRMPEATVPEMVERITALMGLEAAVLRTFRMKEADSLVREFLEMCVASPDGVDLRSWRLHRSFVSWCQNTKGKRPDEILTLKSFNTHCQNHGNLLRQLGEKLNAPEGES